MPNWVRNNVVVNGNKKDLIAFERKHFKTENRERGFDFNTIIEMPSDIFQGNIGEEERKLYGRNNWYDWSIDNWGTKWNASNTQYKGIGLDNNRVFLRFSFDTAWSCPFPIYEKLQKLYPDLAIEVEWADEDIGSNCGTISIYKDEPLVCHMDGDDEFANEVWGYEHIDDEDEEEINSSEVKFSW